MKNIVKSYLESCVPRFQMYSRGGSRGPRLTGQDDAVLMAWLGSWESDPQRRLRLRRRCGGGRRRFGSGRQRRRVDGG